MKRSLVLLALVASCAAQQTGSELQPFEREAGAAALQAWLASGLPSPDQGRCDVSLFRVKLATAAEMPQLCVASSALLDAGCTAYGQTDNLFAWREYPIVVVSPAWKSEPGIIIHELMHGFWHCSGMADELGGGNSQHLDPRVWQATGHGSSAQARALALIAKTTAQ